MPISNRYPLSTADGKSIPFEVLRPHSLLCLNSLLAEGSAAQQIPAEVELLSVLTTALCYIQFFASSTTAGILEEGVPELDTILIPPGAIVMISPPVDKPYLSVRSVEQDCSIFIQFLASWSGLTLQSQITRR